MTIILGLIYVLAGVALGVVADELCRWFKRRPKTAKPEIVDASSTVIQCGACKSVIQSKPIGSIVTSGQVLIAYQCHQCGTQVTVTG